MIANFEEYDSGYGRGHACGEYLLGEYEPEVLIERFTQCKGDLDHFLAWHECNTSVQEFSKSWRQGFVSGLRLAFVEAIPGQCYISA